MLTHVAKGGAGLSPEEGGVEGCCADRSTRAHSDTSGVSGYRRMNSS